MNEFIDILLPIGLGTVTVLGGGQIYLWLDNRRLGNRVTKIEAAQEANGRTLDRIDGTVSETHNCVNEMRAQLARLEGYHEGRTDAQR